MMTFNNHFWLQSSETKSFPLQLFYCRHKNSPNPYDWGFLHLGSI